jgi:hypothetical protein
MAKRRARGFDVAVCGVGPLTAEGGYGAAGGPGLRASGGDGRMVP